MIVAPDMTSHAKFLLYKRALGRDDAAEYLLRIWGHCQRDQRGECWGPVGTAYVEAVAGWQGAPGKLFEVLSAPFCGQSGWITVDGQANITIHGWTERNAQMVACWRNGPTGGRPRKPNGKPADNPTVKPDKPNGKPADNPSRVMGLDGNGLDESSKTHSRDPQWQEPTLAEVLTLASMRGIPEDCATKWYHTSAGAGWIDPQRRPMKNWPHVLQGFAVSWRANEHVRGPAGKKGAPSPVAERIAASERLKCLQKIVADHPANEDSQSYNEGCTEADRMNLLDVEKEIELLTKQLAGKSAPA